jgi:hypothetical protein
MGDSIEDIVGCNEYKKMVKRKGSGRGLVGEGE